MNKVILMGRLTKDVELKFSKGEGKGIANFTIAVNRFKKGEVDFINCVSFGKQAETIAEYTQKGQQVLIEGSLRIENYKDKEGKNRTSASIIVNSFEFVGSKGDSKPPKTDDFLEEVTPESDEDLPW